jgi:hypothetical protein
MFYLTHTSTVPQKQIVDKALGLARDIFRAGKNVELVVKEAKRDRTTQQNRYFWMLCGIIADHAGEDKEVIKMRLMDACGFVIEAWSNGRAIVMPISTTKLKRDQFGTLIEATQGLCEALNLNYPKPEDLGMEW